MRSASVSGSPIGSCGNGPECHDQAQSLERVGRNIERDHFRIADGFPLVVVLGALELDVERVVGLMCQQPLIVGIAAHLLAIDRDEAVPRLERHFGGRPARHGRRLVERGGLRPDGADQGHQPLAGPLGLERDPKRLLRARPLDLKVNSIVWVAEHHGLEQVVPT
jgi:hypothetical protein